MMIRCVLLLGAALAVGCAPADQSVDAESDPAVQPTGVYVKVYAMQFVAAMRKSGVEAGAFEISKKSESDGLFHLGIDVMRAGKSERMDVLLRPDAGGLTLDRATLAGHAVTPQTVGIGSGMDGWHAVAAQAAAAE